MPEHILDTDVYCLTAAHMSGGRSTIDVVARMLEAGVRLVQYREKQKTPGEQYQECLRLREMTHAANAALVVNDDVALAVAVGADGVHVGQEDLPLPAVRQVVGPDMAIGVSTHSAQQARAAVAEGADYIGVGPLFATQTKADVCDPVGLEYLDWVAANIDLPFVAIGGIKTHNVAEVVSRGARCVALVSEITAASDIGAAITAVRSEIAAARGAC
ncbi:MAG: thiamine phosphate synthase [Thermodesulfobacteriota bacterium]